MVALSFTLIIGWIADKLFGDPSWLPHPVVGFGKMITWGEHRFNKGTHLILKGGLMAVCYMIAVYALTSFVLIHLLGPTVPMISWILSAILIYYCLAGTTLISEVEMVFKALDRSLEEGRKQVSRIVGRDTSQLSDQEIRKAALETLAENLNDGVVAPLFWLMLLGVPGMVAYKMVNTLDSMIGYRTQRYLYFGRVAARMDDVANYIPARLTALLMILVACKPKLLSFVRQFGSQHASPNSGYPESALAGILNCQFGGTHIYFGERIEKPFIGTNNRPLDKTDMQTAININEKTEIVMLLIVLGVWWLIP
jgi:adenosylcobinamide-phosphate synthase